MAIFATCLAVTLFCVFIIAAFLHNYYCNQHKESLQTQLNYLVHISDEHNIEHIDAIDSQQKIVVKLQSGKTIQNNADIPLSQDITDELLKESLTSQNGEHLSHLSISERLVVLYQNTENGNVIMIAGTEHTYIALLGSISTYVFIILGLAALVSLILARILSKRILRPIYELNLSNPDKSSVYPELSPLIHKINEQNEEISRRVSLIHNEHEAQDKMRREFTANVSHELKTPLTSISGYAELIRDGLARQEDIPRFAGKIHDESKRMITLVGDIIKLSQLDEKSPSVKFERIDLYDSCQAVLMSLENLAAKRNIELSLKGDHCEINGAQLIIEEIIHNICENAIKYNRENGKVKVSLRQCIDGVELSVKDTGIGIAKDDLDHVFERFYRADKSHSKEIGGTGLGLSIVKHGVQFHNAYVSIDSTLGEGTTVRVLF